MCAASEEPSNSKSPGKMECWSDGVGNNFLKIVCQAQIQFTKGTYMKHFAYFFVLAILAASPAVGQTDFWKLKFSSGDCQGPVFTSSGGIIITNYASDQAGVVRSTDNGSSWQLVGQGLLFFSYAKAPDGTIYGGGSANGFYKSTDEGTTWVQTSRSLPTGVDVIRVNGQGDIFAGTYPSNGLHGGVY